MPDLWWDDVREWFDPDENGVLPNVTVPGTSVGDWLGNRPVGSAVGPKVASFDQEIPLLLTGEAIAPVTAQARRLAPHPASPTRSSATHHSPASRLSGAPPPKPISSEPLPASSPSWAR